MANSNKQTQLKSTDDVNFKMRRSFSWDRSFFTSDGFLGAAELSSMIKGDGDDVKHELQKIDELESLEAELYQEIEASTQKANEISMLKKSSKCFSSGKRDSQAKKITGASGPHKDAPTKTPPKRSSLTGASGSSPTNNVKSPARRSMGSITGKDNVGSPSRTPPAIITKNTLPSVNTRVSRTSPASPVSPRSPGSSPSAFSVTQRSKRRDSVPHKSSVNNEKPSPTNERRTDDRKASKRAVSVTPKTQSSISLKIKPPPMISHPSSPSGSTTQRWSLSSSCTVDQRSKSHGTKGSPVHHASKPALKNHPIGQTSDPNRKQPAKTAAAASSGVQQNSPKTKKQSSPKAKESLENIYIISPELLDLKGKINALKMEINMHKDRCNKMVRAEGNLKTAFTIKECSV
ncbi:hypothetical protein HanPI659440_Chr14g0565321 [Helianthus annuus]|nr:hypothetical protein HanPI659440_Chr14g0565321 [Helianthus annuus]